MKSYQLLLFFNVCLLLACNQKKKESSSKVFELQENSGINFVNNIQDNKDFNIFAYRNFYNGGGVALGDINNDGLTDVFFTANMGSNKLYLNKGNFEFEDISEKAGIGESDKWNTGVTMVDINNDGWLDIYVCNAGINKWKNKQANALFINNHDLSFTDKAKEYGLDHNGYSTQSSFFDYDLDGDLDCYILNNSFIPVNTLNYSNKRELRAKDWPVADFLKGGGSYLMRNDNGKFTDVSEEAGIFGSLISFGLLITVVDVKGDHYPDIYVSNDFFERDYLYINQKNGKFSEELEKWMQHTSMSSMGADLSDINNDGYPDLFVTDMLPDNDYRLKTTTSFENFDVFRLKENRGFYRQYMQNTLQINNKNGKFMETAHYSGVAASDWSWGGLIFDADGDGYSDIFVCNGIYHDVTNQDFIDFFADEVIQRMVLTGEKEQVNEIINKMPSVPLSNKLFRNMGNLQFTESAAKWGLDQPTFSNGSAYGDLDNDGDLDLVVNNLGAEAFVYKNNTLQTSGNNYVSFSLTGSKTNRFAVGSKVEVFLNGSILSREIIPAKGFQSSVDYKAIIGLGKGQPDSIRIWWPDMSVTSIQKPLVNKLYKIQYDSVERQSVPNSISTAQDQMFTSAIDSTSFDRHREDDFVDFYSERNIPFILSKEGPKATVADVNKDGLEDLFIGGGPGQAGQLYLQTTKGFRKAIQGSIAGDSLAEDVAVLFFDCDKDGDMDLFVGSGGNNIAPRQKLLEHRLYKNDGRGNFTKVNDAFPINEANISVAVENDFDNDGDLDLFVGARNAPFSYGIFPNSYLFQNDGNGKFTEISESIIPGNRKLGMVTSAAWADIYGSDQKELIVVGEWMTPKVFSRNANGIFELVKTNLDNLFGFWQSLKIEDLDGDGKKDLILGNFGENFDLKPDSTRPVHLWINDFDRNESVEKIFTRSVGNKDVPVFLKRDLTDQIVVLKKSNLKYDDFGKKAIQDLFEPQLISSSVVRTYNYPSSCIAWNEGNGKFSVQKLDPRIQYSTVNAILCEDINNDGRKDLILGGNKYDLLPQFGRLDASYGEVLLNLGNRKLELASSSVTGILVDGQVRDIISINSPGKNKLISFILNQKRPVFFSVRGKRS